MDRAELIKMAKEAGGSEFRTESGNDHTRINHFFEMTIDELELFASMVRSGWMDIETAPRDDREITGRGIK